MVSRMLRLCTFALVAAVVAASLAGCGSQSAPRDTPPADQPAPDSPSSNDAGDSGAADDTVVDAAQGRALLEQHCTRCHGLDRIESVSRDRSGWESTVSRMERNGLRIDAQDREAVIDYLAAEY